MSVVESFMTLISFYVTNVSIQNLIVVLNTLVDSLKEKIVRYLTHMHFERSTNLFLYISSSFLTSTDGNIAPYFL